MSFVLTSTPSVCRKSLLWFRWWRGFRRRWWFRRW